MEALNRLRICAKWSAHAQLACDSRQSFSRLREKIIIGQLSKDVLSRGYVIECNYKLVRANWP